MHHASLVQVGKKEGGIFSSSSDPGGKSGSPIFCFLFLGDGCPNFLAGVEPGWGSMVKLQPYK